MTKFDDYIKLSPDPEIAELRISYLLQKNKINKFVNKLNDEKLNIFIRLVTISNFLYHFISRNPETLLNLFQSSNNINSALEDINDISALRLYKYQRLLDITWQDIDATVPYEQVLDLLSILADQVINKVLDLLFSEQSSTDKIQNIIPMCIFAMGKLGALELNFSSDVDLIFVCADEDAIDNEYDEYQLDVTRLIRKFSRILTDITEDGFLYRVDLNIRPLGRSGPLVLSVTDTENYYAVSTEAWERFAWLRARIIAGEQELGDDLLQRLQPFIYLRTLSSDDLDRFIQIKKDMAVSRQRSDCWNVKLGIGGIRDIEFFIQVLQIANAYKHPTLQTTNTLAILNGLIKCGLIELEEGSNIRECYLFLRRLENRLQMVDEKQTHELPHDCSQRLIIARSFGYVDSDNDGNLERFDEQLEHHRMVASQCYERILPGD
jgi:glutamate-ammonia-ligase adenylyltransferase